MSKLKINSPPLLFGKGGLAVQSMGVFRELCQTYREIFFNTDKRRLLRRQTQSVTYLKSNLCVCLRSSLRLSVLNFLSTG
jgi:hypothetical protein